MDELTSGNQFLSFVLRGEYFAIEITKVREVLDVTTLTKIPRMPDYLCGVINLRGNVVPVVDLGLKLAMPSIEKTVNTCIMIMEISIENEDDAILMGVLTDSVQEVFELSPEELEAVPKMGAKLNTDFIKAMGHHGDRFIILLDIDRILESEGEAVLRDFEESALREQKE